MLTVRIYIFTILREVDFDHLQVSPMISPISPLHGKYQVPLRPAILITDGRALLIYVANMGIDYYIISHR